MTLRELHEETPAQADARMRSELDAQFAYWQARLQLDHQEAEARMRAEFWRDVVPIVVACFIVAGTAMVSLWGR